MPQAHDTGSREAELEEDSEAAPGEPRPCWPDREGRHLGRKILEQVQKLFFVLAKG